MKFLMTFCNVSYLPDQYFLGVYDWTHHDMKYVSLPLERFPLSKPGVGATGLIRQDERYFLVLQSTPAYLLCLDRDFNVLSSKALDLVQDAHSLVFYRESIYIASTGNNSIVKVSFDGDFGDEEVFVRLNNSSENRLHLNSIAFWKDEAIVACFGLERGSQIIRHGFVKNVSSDVTLLEGIREPHNLMVRDGFLYVLESSTGGLYQISPRQEVTLMKEFGSYGRGLAFWEDDVFLVRNARRMLSRQVGGKKNIPLVDASAEVCEWKHSWICCSKIGEETYTKKNLTAFAFEVYDLVPLIAEPSSKNLVKDGISHRILSYESLCARLRHQVKALHEQKVKEKARCEEIQSQLQKAQEELVKIKGKFDRASEEVEVSES